MTTKTARRESGASTGQPTGRAEVVPLHGGGRLAAPWKPGQSGNPNGVISVGAYHEARRICAAACPDAARIQVELMSSEDEAHSSHGDRGRAQPRRRQTARSLR